MGCGSCPPAGPCCSAKQEIPESSWAASLPASVLPSSVLPSSTPASAGAASGMPASSGAVTWGHAVPASAQRVLRVALSNGSQVLPVHADSSCCLVCGLLGHASGAASDVSCAASTPESPTVPSPGPTDPSLAPTT